MRTWSHWPLVVLLSSACATKASPPAAAPLATDAELAAAERDPANAMKLHFIDVGQGDATLIEMPCGIVLVDTGGEDEASTGFHSRDELADYLQRFFADRPNKRIDLLVVTHPHIDHDRNVAWVLEEYEVGNVVDNGQNHSSGTAVGQAEQYQMAKWLAAHPDVGHWDVIASTIDEVDGLSNAIIDPIGSCEASSIDPEIKAMWGQGPSTMPGNANNHSVVLRVRYGRGGVLFTGDLQKEAIGAMLESYGEHASQALDVEVYQVGHHTSHNATTKELMEAMTPKIAVSGTGPYERRGRFVAYEFGHPNEKALEHILSKDYGVSLEREPTTQRVGKKGRNPKTHAEPEFTEPQEIEGAYYMTGWDGDVVVTVFPDGWVEVETER